MKNSPILNICSNVPDSVIRIAPEKKDEILQIIDNHKIKFCLTDKRGFIFEVETNHSHIRTSINGLEYLWAACYAYYVVYQEAVEIRRKNVMEMVFAENPKTELAVQLLEWAMCNQVSENDLEWPVSLPKPEKNPTNGSDIQVVNELFLCSVAWILHHELAHIRLGHSNVSNSPLSIAEEKEADRNATEWILNGVSEPIILEKRLLGIVLANLIITSFGIEKKSFSSPSHPKSFSRLYNSLNAITLDKNHKVFQFSTFIMKLHIDHSKIDMPMKEFENYRDCFNEYCFILSRIENVQ